MTYRLNLLLILSGLALLPVSVLADDTNALETLQQSCQKQEQALLDDYGKALGALMADSKKKGDLDLYLVVETESKRFATEKYVPSLSDANAALKSAAGIYCRARTGILKKYVSALDGLIKTEVQADRMESAKAAKAEKDKIAFELADLESKLQKPADRMKVREASKQKEVRPAQKSGPIDLSNLKYEGRSEPDSLSDPLFHDLLPKDGTSSLVAKTLRHYTKVQDERRETRTDVLLMHPKDQGTPSTLDLSAITKGRRGTLLLSLLNMPGGDSVAKVFVGVKEVESVTVCGNVWTDYSIPFANSSVRIENHANGWEREYLLISIRLK